MLHELCDYTEVFDVILLFCQMKRKIEAFNELEKFIYTVRHTIHDTTKLGSKISDEDRKTIDKALDKVSYS